MKKTLKIFSFLVSMCLLFAFSTSLSAQTVDISILTDQFGGETSWEITDDMGNAVLTGPPGGVAYPGDTQIDEQYMLPPGTYTFTIFDAFGDGICCAYGNGEYEVTLDGVVIASGDGDFGADETSAPFEVMAPSDIPTLSQWGLMTLALLLMAFGSVKMAVGSVAFSGVGNRNIPLPGNNSFKLPFSSAIFRKSLLFTGAMALIGFAICFAIYGAIFMTDIIGFAVAGPIFAYLIHLLYVLETRREKK